MSRNASIQYQGGGNYDRFPVMPVDPSLFDVNEPTEWDADRLAQWMERHGISHAELARRLGLKNPSDSGRKSVNRWLSGEPIMGPVRAALDSWEQIERIRQELDN